MTGDRYALHHDGTWFYYLPEVARVTWVTGSPEVAADGEPMTACEKAGWYSAAREAAVITVTRPAHPVTIGHRLADPDTASVRYPLTLTVAEYEQRREIEDDERIFALYDRVTEPGDPSVEEISGPWLRLDGAPPPADGRTWHAALPAELTEHPEYLHLFPGYLGGFRARVTKTVERMPRVRYSFDGASHGRGAVIEVTVEVPFDKPLTRYEPARNQDGSRSRSRKGRTVTETATRSLVFPAPDRVAAVNRAAAAAKWDEWEAEIVQAVTEASVAACSHCRGTGHVIAGAEKFEGKAS